jgi:GTP-binding protein
VPPERVAEAVAQWSARLGAGGVWIPVIATSAATGAGLQELAGELLRLVPASVTVRGVATGVPGSATGPDNEDVDANAPASGGARPEEGHGGTGPALARGGELAEHMVYRPAARDGFSVERIGPGTFAVRGRGVERLLQRFDVENEDAMAYVESRLRRLGVIQALQDKGFQPGDDIEIAGTGLELDPSV